MKIINVVFLKLKMKEKIELESCHEKNKVSKYIKNLKGDISIDCSSNYFYQKL